jgi:uncharacterized protein (TIGR02145 family)
MKIATLLFIPLVIFSSCWQKQSVTIGSQVWSTKNLDVATFCNGEVIPEAKTAEEWSNAGDNKKAAWCYYDNDPKNENKYGKLYNWYAVNDVRGLAPIGWHIPTDKEWKVLYDFLGGEFIAGEKMKNSSGWLENGNGSNSSGFSGLPGGSCSILGTFMFGGKIGIWWSASKQDASKHKHLFPSYWELDYSNSYLERHFYFEEFGFSVRCVKD